PTEFELTTNHPPDPALRARGQTNRTSIGPRLPVTQPLRYVRRGPGPSAPSRRPPTFQVTDLWLSSTGPSLGCGRRVDKDHQIQRGPRLARRVVFRVRPGPVLQAYRAGAREADGAPAARGRLGARGQVRRLPPCRAPEGRRRAAHHPP